MRYARDDKLKIHFENNRHLGEVFDCSRKQIAKALAHRKALAAKLDITIGYDGDIFEKATDTD